MPKRTVFTNITPLPPQISREMAIAMLHNHSEMIELNPLVIEHHPIQPPHNAPTDELLDCTWEELTDRIHYLPGGIAKGKISYKACFHDLPNGLQTHVYAPMGLHIREKWTVCGSLPDEPLEPVELGLKTPRRGLYLREDGDMKCNALLTNFVRKNLDNSHRVLVQRMLKKAERIERRQPLSTPDSSPAPPASFQTGLYMANSPFSRPQKATFVQQHPPPGVREIHLDPERNHRHNWHSNTNGKLAISELPSYQSLNDQQTHYYENDLAKHHQKPRAYIAELEGSLGYAFEPSLSDSFETTSSEDRPNSRNDGSKPSTLKLDNMRENHNEVQRIWDGECTSASSERSFDVGGESRFCVRTRQVY